MSAVLLTLERNKLIERALPRILRASRVFACRAPSHLRDEAVDELLVRAVEIAGGWRPDGGKSFANFVCDRLWWAFLDWLGAQHREATLDGIEVPCVEPSPQRTIELLEAIRLLAQLPSRERIALTAPTVHAAQERLRATKDQVGHLRVRAGKKLVELGAAELLGLVA